MSPERVSRSGYSSSNSSSKPYSRNVLPSLVPNSLPPSLDSPYDSASCPPSTESSLLPGSGNTQASASTPTAERHGFPTYVQYKQIETGYIESLTPRRQGKALISQSMFDRIWDVLHHPESQLETAQFRFWARKMFTLNKNYRITLGVADGQESPPQEVLLHDNLLVAIQEQLYDLLCYCHGSTGHGGRDKTCALIRKHYTWVPKDLVSNFIKACPTCIMKKCGNMDVNSQIPLVLTAEVDKSGLSSSSARLVSTGSSRTHHSPADENNGVLPSGRPRRQMISPVLQSIQPHQHDQHYHHLTSSPTPSGSGGGGGGLSMLRYPGSNAYLKMSASLAPTSPTLQDGAHGHQMVATSLPWSLLSSYHHQQGVTLAPVMSPDANGTDVQGNSISHNSIQEPSAGVHVSSINIASYPYQPMVREVSLYRGLPNGWQYRHDDFDVAHAEFVESKRQWGGSGGALDGAVGGVGMDEHQHHLQSFPASQYAISPSPRVPDVAGLWLPEHFKGLVKDESMDNELGLSALPDHEGMHLHAHGQGAQHHQQVHSHPPSMMRALDLSEMRGFGAHSGSLHLDSPSMDDHVYELPPIDPRLLALSDPNNGSAGPAPHILSVGTMNLEVSTSAESPPPSVGEIDDMAMSSCFPLRSPSIGIPGEEEEEPMQVELERLPSHILSTSSTAKSLAQRVTVPPALDFSNLNVLAVHEDRVPSVRRDSLSAEGEALGDKEGISQLLSPPGLTNSAGTGTTSEVTTPVDMVNPMEAALKKMGVGNGNEETEDLDYMEA